MDISYRGTSIRTDVRPNRTWAHGRVCASPGCRTRLSIYNRSAECSVHEAARVYVVRGKRRSARSEGVVATAA
jgi:hypothetical protein